MKRARRRSSLSRSRGFSLLEIALALAIVGVTFASVATLYIQSTSEGNVSDYVAFHTVLETSVKSTWANNNYEGLDSDTAADLFSANPKLVQNDELRGPRGVGVTVGPRTLPGSGANRHFAIAYEDIPSSVCSSLVFGLAERTERAEIGGAVIYQRGQDIDAQAITLACAAAGADLAIVPVN